MRRRWTGRRYDTGELVHIDTEDGVIVAVVAAAAVVREEGEKGTGVSEEESECEGMGIGVSQSQSQSESFCWISPGWIDLQVNGFAGYDLNGEVTTPEDVFGVASALFPRGVTNFCPTIITGSAERIRQTLHVIHAACEQDELLGEAIPGIHLEGPYLSAEDGPRGAHDKAHIREPEWAEFAAWQEAAGGRIALCTVAPEKEGAVRFIRQLRGAGVQVSIGHTMAVAEELGDAVAAGASMSTHLGNGAHPVLPRHPNYIWEQLADDGLTAMFIADGHHLGAAALKAMIRAKQGRFILVSDSVKFGGMPPGRYESEIGQRVELLSNGRLQTAADPRILAGSAQPLICGIENAMKLASVSLAEAIDAVTKRPAEAMGWQELGRLEPGARANLTLFRLEEEDGGVNGLGLGRIQIVQTVVGGRTVWQDGQALW